MRRLVSPSWLWPGFLLAMVGCDRAGVADAVDSFLLVTPVAGGTDASAEEPLVEKRDPVEPALRPLTGLLTDGFDAELLRTIYLAQRYIRHSERQGQHIFAGTAHWAATHPVVFLIGAPSPLGQGIALHRLWGRPVPHPEIPWLGLPVDYQTDPALAQTLAAALGGYLMRMMIASDAQASSPPSVLARAYPMAMQVIAREWKARIPGERILFDAGTPAQRRLFASIRENRFVLAEDGHSLRSAPDLLASPGVAATVLYRLAQARTVANRAADAADYTPFDLGALPEKVVPAQVLGSFRNFQAKLLLAWGTGIASGRPPENLVDLLEMYTRRFPQERAEVVRIFVVTTFGGTVKPGGVSLRPADSSVSLAELNRLVGEIGAGRLTLRSAVDR